ncbi:MAG: protein kinase [Candidatus Nanopelagicales bacterium]
MSENQGRPAGERPEEVGPAPQPAGDALGAGYRLFNRLGGGAMGEVRRGQTSSGESVAVKILRPEFADDPSMIVRFLQERSILTGLTDENVVHVRDLVAEGTTLAIVMDLVDGPDLRKELVARGTLPPAEAAGVVTGVLRGLAAVHSAGVVHRDVKPENVLLDSSTRPGQVLPRVTDFGISKLVDQKSAVRRTSVIGTPEYMAPELIDDSDPTVASDLYSVGIMLYELLTGVTPFGGGSPLAVLRKHAELTPGRPQGIPDSLWAVIAGLLAKDPATRPATAEQVAASLDGQLAGLASLPALPKLAEAPIVQPDPETVLKSLTPPKPGGAEPSPERKGVKRPLLVGALVVALLAAGGGAFAVFRSGNSDPSPVAVAAPASSSSPTASPSPSTPSASASSAASAPASSVAPSSAAEPNGLMPDVVNMTVSEATDALARIGVESDVVERLDTTVADGTVIAQSPPAGQNVSDTAELTVGRREQTVWLSDMGPVAGSPDYEPVNVNGKNYVHTLLANDFWNCPGGAESWEYDLGRSFTNFQGSVGLSDDSDSEAKVQAEIYSDGTRLFNKSASLGNPAKFDVDVTNGLRLKLVMTPTECGEDDFSLAWLDSQLTGIPSMLSTAP